MHPAVATSGRARLPSFIAENGEAEVEFIETDADACMPAQARRFGITDLQHWIDLCA
jgi:hypothetical protein